MHKGQSKTFHPDHLTWCDKTWTVFKRTGHTLVTLPVRSQEDGIYKPPSRICPAAQNVCHLALWPCSHNRRSLSLMTMLAKSVSSTKSEVMMLTPSIPGLWDSTQDMMAGRFLESQEKKKKAHTLRVSPTPWNSTACLRHRQNKTRKLGCWLSGDKQWHFLGSAKLGHLLSRWGPSPWHQCLFLSHVSV